MNQAQRNCWIQGAQARMRDLPRETSWHVSDGTAQAWLDGWDHADAALKAAGE